MTEQTLSKDAFVALLEPVIAELAQVSLDDPAAARDEVARRLPADDPRIATLREAALSARDSEWLLPRAAGEIRYGRVVKDLAGFSVDAVLMAGPGPRHRHPNGEIDLCFTTAGAPRFDGQAPGWVVYGADSVHVPTVKDGEMLILYFLPGGAIEFLQ
ncbi:MAG: DUF4863 family protein [Planctomycetota bacterium]